MAKETNKSNEMNVEEALSKSEAFILKNKNVVLGGIAAVILVIVGIMCYKNFISDPHELAASEALYKGEQYFGAEQFETALNGDSLGYMGFIQIADEYSSTDAGNLANAYAGISLAQLKKYEEAVKYLTKFSGDDEMIAPAVLGALGNCYANLNQEEKAAATLMEAAEEADNHSLSPIYLLQAGQIYEKLGKNNDAVEAYKMIKDKYFNSMQAYDIDKYIERASIK